MKKLLMCLVGMFILSTLIVSCSATRKDCQGVRHTKQKGGFYL